MADEITSAAVTETTETSTPLQVETTSLLDGVDTGTGSKPRPRQR